MSKEDVLRWDSDLREPSQQDKADALRLYRSIQADAARDAVLMMTRFMMITAADRISFDDEKRMIILEGVTRSALTALNRAGLALQEAGDFVLACGIPAEQIEAVSGWKGGK